LCKKAKIAARAKTEKAKEEEEEEKEEEEEEKAMNARVRARRRMKKRKRQGGKGQRGAALKPQSEPQASTPRGIKKQILDVQPQPQKQNRPVETGEARGVPNGKGESLGQAGKNRAETRAEVWRKLRRV
jgi:hypothetical protein